MLQSKLHVFGSSFTVQFIRRSAEREAVGSNPGRTNSQGLYISEKKVPPL